MVESRSVNTAFYELPSMLYAGRGRLSRGCTRLASAELRRPLPPAPLGACFLPIVDRYLQRIEGGAKVLDVGCGSWTKIRDHCRRVGATYEAIDVQAAYYGAPTVATRIENLFDLSFPGSSFDFIISNQSMEHWGEYGCGLRRGLYQCFRVCKLGGQLLLNVPIYFHGTKEFLLGDYGSLLEHLGYFTEDIYLEKWGHPSGELPEYYPWPGYWRLRGRPAYILDIQMTKTRDTQPEARPGLGFSGPIA